jgi:hypothetical protein
MHGRTENRSRQSQGDTGNCRIRLCQHAPGEGPADFHQPDRFRLGRRDFPLQHTQEPHQVPQPAGRFTDHDLRAGSGEPHSLCGNQGSRGTGRRPRRQPQPENLPQEHGPRLRPGRTGRGASDCHRRSRAGLHAPALRRPPGSRWQLASKYDYSFRASRSIIGGGVAPPVGIDAGPTPTINPISGVHACLNNPS